MPRGRAGDDTGHGPRSSEHCRPGKYLVTAQAREAKKCGGKNPARSRRPSPAAVDGRTLAATCSLRGYDMCYAPLGAPDETCLTGTAGSTYGRKYQCAPHGSYSGLWGVVHVQQGGMPGSIVQRLGVVRPIIRIQISLTNYPLILPIYMALMQSFFFLSFA